MSETTTNDSKSSIPHGERTVVAVLRPCHRQWSELEPTDRADVRFCFDCCQSVVHVHTIEGAMQAAALGRCVYVEQVEHHESRGPHLGGMPIIEDYRRQGPLVWED